MEKTTIYQIILILNIDCWNAFSDIFQEIEKCKITSHGSEYIGTTSKTFSGKSCVPWKKAYIDGLSLSSSYYYDESAITDIVFCRNPTQFPKGPWCFVNKNTLEWEYCNIPSCVKERHWCKTSDEGTEYMGSINYTMRGNACKAWVDKAVYRDELFPEKSMFYAGNKCRNPENMQAPWCFYAYSWEFCNVPECEKKFSQVDFFGGYDFLKSNLKYTKIIPLNELYQSLMVTVSVHIVLWQWDVRRKTSMWATDYDLKCQTDMNSYEYCEMYRSMKSYDQVIMTYWCRRPLRYLIFISSLRHSSFHITYSGTVYVPTITPSEEFLKYQEKIRNFIARKDKLISTFPVDLHNGHFYLLYDNVIPYAITHDDKVMVTISTVGKGCVAFLHSQIHLFDESGVPLKDYTDLADLFQQVFKSRKVLPQKLTVEFLKTLKSNWQNKNDVSTPVIWNTADEIGKPGIEVLLNLIKAGLRIIMEITLWENPKNIVDSELEVLFFELGIWPSVEQILRKIKVTNKEEILTFPLVHLIDYATMSKSNAMYVADTIKTILLNVPFQFLVNIKDYERVFSNFQSFYLIYLPFFKQLIPCLNKPLTNEDDKAIIGLLNAILISPFGKSFIAPGLSFYPGYIQQNDVQLITARMKLHLVVPDEIYQLGLYAIPGEEFSVKITYSMSKQCTIHLNFQLFSVLELSEWRKWPITSTKFYIYPNILKKFSFPFGGLISIQCQQNDDHINIDFHRVVRIPYYDRRNDKMFDDWAKINNIVSPWVILAGDSLVFIVSSHAVRNLAEPDKILTLYDSAVKELFHLKGKSVSHSRREVISTDIQIEKGYMHSGYPIATKIPNVTDHEGFHIFNKKSIETNDAWAILHEIGHNLQDEMFTFRGAEEVTNNIFTLVGIESVTNKSSWSPSEGWLKSRLIVGTMVTYLNYGYFSEWETIRYLALGVYAQLRNSFGWELYSQIFRRYKNFERMDIHDGLKLKLWINTSSYVSGMNLCPFYDLWRWPIDISACENLKHLRFFIPDDFLTRMVEGRVTEIIYKYGGPKWVKRIPNKIPKSIGPVKNKYTVEGSKIIEEIQITNLVY